MSADLAALECGEAHLWFGEVSGRVSGEDFELLSEREHDRARRFHHCADQLRFVAVWAAVRRVMAGYLGSRPEDVKFGQNGPEHRGGPRYSPGMVVSTLPWICLSVARSEDFWLLGVSVDDPIGVDVEHMRAFDTEGLIDRCLAPEERLQVRAFTGEARRQAFMRAWTRKEALAKAAGLPQSTAPHRIVVHPGRIGAARTVLPQRPGFDWMVQDVPLPIDACAAFARLASCTGPVHLFDAHAGEGIPDRYLIYPPPGTPAAPDDPLGGPDEFFGLVREL